MAEALSVAGMRAAAPVPAPVLSTLVVEGMHCGACMRSVENVLTAVPGVASARANLSAHRVTLITLEKPATLEPYIAALEAAGFKATPLADAPSRAGGDADRDYLRRLAVAGFAAANIMLLSVSVWAGHANDMSAAMQALFHWLSALIALPAVAYAGNPFFSSARQALGAGRLNMDVPISLGVLLATGMSLYQTVRGSEQVYFDAAVTLLFFLLVGRYLDLAMRSRARSAAENLLGLGATSAAVIGADGRVERIGTDAVVPGMRLVVAAGERVPVDARVAGGAGEFDESMITGESRPRAARIGEIVYSGSIALTGPIEVEATTAAENTLVADIARMMQTAEQARGRYVRLADRAARLYAPAVHIAGAATFLGWLAAGQGWEAALTAAVAVLIVTCPCALALAVPAVQVAAVSRLFRRGIIVKSADGLERLAEIDSVVLDKTGTLTLGEPRLVDPGAVPDDVLSRAAALAALSRHPYSRAIVKTAGERGLKVVAVSGAGESAGAGVSAEIAGHRVALGSASFVGAESGSDASLYFRDGDAAPIAFRFIDPVRTDAARTVERLAAGGAAVEILSGDREGAVAEAAKAVGIERYRGGQRPDQKIARLDELKAEGRRVLMVGDGLNDAPALAAGHAAMSPSTAADISQTAADVVFQGERLGAVGEAIAVARAARGRALQNFAIAIGYNMIFVPLAMAGMVTPLIAAVAMSASSIAVTANALRLQMQRLEEGQ